MEPQVHYGTTDDGVGIEPVRHLLAGKGFLIADGGQFMAKGFEQAVRLYEVRWQDV